MRRHLKDLESMHQQHRTKARFKDEISLILSSIGLVVGTQAACTRAVAFDSTQRRPLNRTTTIFCCSNVLLHRHFSLVFRRKRILKMVTTRSAGPGASLRRSARLSGTGSLGQDEFLRILQDKTQRPSKKRKRRNVGHDDVEELASPAKRERASSVETSSNVNSGCREKALNQRELDLKKKQEDLDSQTRNLDTIVKEKEKEMTLEFLDENLSCALCCEIIACPYAPTSANCGHSFCAICILKWFFSRLHRACGSWHENVACPFCRTPLAYTPAFPPRDLSTFPFSPNRLADACIRSAIEKLASSSLPDNPGPPKPGANGRNQTQRVSRVKKEESVGLGLESDIEGWKEGGRNRIEWNARERLGHDEMVDMRNRWPRLTPDDFAAIKIRLSV